MTRDLGASPDGDRAGHASAAEPPSGVSGKAGIPIATFVIAMFVASSVIGVVKGIEARKLDARELPPYAGKLCDQVWHETRPNVPTVGWFRACINEAAKVAARIDARSGETRNAARSEGRKPEMPPKFKPRNPHA